MLGASAIAFTVTMLALTVLPAAIDAYRHNVSFEPWLYFYQTQPPVTFDGLDESRDPFEEWC